MTKIVHDELVDLMGGSQEGINLSGKPSVILLQVFRVLVRQLSQENCQLFKDKKK
jgi:hypothetical protein